MSARKERRPVEGAPDGNPPQSNQNGHEEGSTSPEWDQPADAGGRELGEQTEYRLAEARKAHDRGWALTPLDGKAPIRKGWQKAPVPPLEAVESWAAEGNVGLRTGNVSGVVAIDDDTEDGSGVATLTLPKTVTSVTGSGKRHYLFRSPKGGLTNSPGNLPPKVDVRGDGGQVVFVGSIHPDTGRQYRWAPGLSPDDVEMAELPQHVIDLIQAPRAKRKRAKRAAKRRPPVDVDQSAQVALEEAAAAVAAAKEGSRNEALNTEAFRMGSWVGTGRLTRDQVETALADAARSTGLGDDEIANTIQSGLDAGVPTRPSILLEGGALPQIVQQAEDALLKTRAVLYQRGNMLVRAMRAPAMTMRDVYRRAEGVLMLCAVEVPFLVELLTRSATWNRMNRGELLVVDCPERVARTYLARSGHWRMPTLLSVIETPTLRPDGSVLDKPGYDTETGLLFEPGAVKFPPIPEKPTWEDASAALNILKEVIKDFPWLEPCDRSAALAAILTALIRTSLRTSPLFAFRAPKMASGKSLLADVVALIATGRVASVMSQGKDEDEDKKRMLAILMEGINVACIDNIERDFGGSALCSVLTQETWRERVLGKTGTATVPTTTTWLATGNNIRFVGDIVTRVVVSDLDPKVEKPEEREFDVDLHEYIPEHRAELVVAGLTVLRAYRVAGSPDQNLAVFGRFEQWSGWVRSALVWLGEADPCAGRARLYQYDPVGSQLRALLAAWYEKLGDQIHTGAEVIGAAAPLGEVSSGPLHQALQAVAMGAGGKVDARRLGNYLAKYERRTEAGLRIERVGERQGSALWRVISVDQGPAPSDDDGAPPVGLVGIVGLSQPVQGENAPPYDSAEPAGKNARENRSDPGPSAKVPRRPRNPRPPGGDPHFGAVEPPPDHGRGDGRPSRPCGACTATKWWRRKPAGLWICGNCHPPAPAPSEIEWAP